MYVFTFKRTVTRRLTERERESVTTAKETSGSWVSEWLISPSSAGSSHLQWSGIKGCGTLHGPTVIQWWVYSNFAHRPVSHRQLSAPSCSEMTFCFQQNQCVFTLFWHSMDTHASKTWPVATYGLSKCPRSQQEKWKDNLPTGCLFEANHSIVDQPTKKQTCVFPGQHSNMESIWNFDHEFTTHCRSSSCATYSASAKDQHSFPCNECKFERSRGMKSCHFQPFPRTINGVGP